ncbi:hypothetical protein [Sphaerisporangium sp. NPDC051011]|uniref:hypothetical protein n=1 Tax=Sphaerisporangium sp. NPDC051011 TaxID=3155792 RepID=UPI0033D2591B
MANKTIIQTMFNNVAEWAVAIVAVAAVLTSGAAAVQAVGNLTGNGAVADGNTWPAPAANGNTWPAPVADGNTWPAPVADGNTWPVVNPDGNTWPKLASA